MDATELTRGKLVAAACGVLLLLLMFWSWFDVSSVGGTAYSARYAAADLDTTIKTLADTGKDMNSKYKETSEAGLAQNLVLC